jgi:hypothetical protein
MLFQAPVPLVRYVMEGQQLALSLGKFKVQNKLTGIGRLKG